MDTVSMIITREERRRISSKSNKSNYSNSKFPENRGFVNWRGTAWVLPAAISSRLLPITRHSCATSAEKKIGSCLPLSFPMRKWTSASICVIYRLFRV